MLVPAVLMVSTIKYRSFKDLDLKSRRSFRVLIPIAALFLRAFEMSWHDFFKVVTNDRALAAYRLTFGASFVAAIANAVFGTILAWVLVRYDFPGKRFIDALVDFPFALPLEVAFFNKAIFSAPCCFTKSST